LARVDDLRVRLPILTLLVVAGLIGASAGVEAFSVHAAAKCDPANSEATTVIIDGDLYGMVRAQNGRYLFGWSGPPVLSFDEALRLIKALGVKGTREQLFSLILGPGIFGGDYSEGGSIGYFDVHCPGVYRATVVVRRERFLPATRIWLQQQEGIRVRRSFCMAPRWLPGGARLSVTFASPLQAKAPVFTIDRNADGTVDGRGSFHRGGARFPDRESC
jgi:hypothetical protein